MIMSTEIERRPSEISLLKEQLKKIKDKKTKLDLIDGKKVEIAKEKYDFQSLNLMVFLNKKQIQTENEGINKKAALLEAHIQEATRIRTKLKQPQPKGVNLEDGTLKEIENFKAAKKHLRNKVIELRAPVQKDPSKARLLDPSLRQKLHLQPRK